MMKKYEFTGETKTYYGRTLHRIKAISNFGGVVEGEIGGWIESKNNLSQDGDAWVSGDAWVYGNARVSGEYTHLLIGPIGSRESYTTFFTDKEKQIMVSCGCFEGTLDEFAAKVEEVHGDNRHGKAYKAAIEYVKAVMVK